MYQNFQDKIHYDILVQLQYSFLLSVPKFAANLLKQMQYRFVVIYETPSISIFGTKVFLKTPCLVLTRAKRNILHTSQGVNLPETI